MKFQKMYKPEICCSNDETRLILHNVCVKHAGADGTEREAFLDATNGRCLVRVPCTIETGDIVGDGMIPDEVIKFVRAKTKAKIIKGKFGKKDTLPAVIRIVMLKDAFVFDNGDFCITWKRQDQGVFPNTEQVIPTTTGKPVDRLVFDPMLLSDLLTAMGGDRVRKGVHLKSEDDISPIIVKANFDARVLGVLMPMRMGE